MTETRKLAEGDDPFSALSYEQMFDALTTVKTMAHQQILNGDGFPLAIDEFYAGLEALRRKVVSVQQAMAWSDYRSSHGVPTGEAAMRKVFVAGWEAALSQGVEEAAPDPVIDAILGTPTPFADGEAVGTDG